MGKKIYFTKYEEQNICNSYINSSVGCLTLSKKYGISQCTMLRLLKRNKVKIKTLSEINRDIVNENYFGQINSEDKAYFLGLLYADGCNIVKRNRMSISLQEEDKYILETFRDKIQSNKIIKIYNRNNPKWKNVAYFSIGNRKICSDLYNLGCIPKKSLTLKFPNKSQVPDYLLNHFVRGYFDGDGCISISRRTNLQKVMTKFAAFNLVSTFEFCCKLRTLILKETNVDLNLKKDGRKNNITSYIYTGKTKDIIKIMDWLYNDSTIYLNRKYKKYLEIKTYTNKE